MKTCRRCKGSGVDPDLAFRYTTGGHNDRSCKQCNGEGYLDVNCTKESMKASYYKLRNAETDEFVKDQDGNDRIFTDAAEAHINAYDIEEDGIILAINVVAFDENGVELC